MRFASTYRSETEYTYSSTETISSPVLKEVSWSRAWIESASKDLTPPILMDVKEFILFQGFHATFFVDRRRNWRKRKDESHLVEGSEAASSQASLSRKCVSPYHESMQR